VCVHVCVCAYACIHIDMRANMHACVQVGRRAGGGRAHHEQATVSGATMYAMSYCCGTQPPHKQLRMERCDLAYNHAGKRKPNIAAAKIVFLCRWCLLHRFCTPFFPPEPLLSYRISARSTWEQIGINSPPAQAHLSFSGRAFPSAAVTSRRPPIDPGRA